MVVVLLVGRDVMDLEDGDGVDTSSSIGDGAFGSSRLVVVVVVVVPQFPVPQ